LTDNSNTSKTGSLQTVIYHAQDVQSVLERYRPELGESLALEITLRDYTKTIKDVIHSMAVAAKAIWPDWYLNFSEMSQFDYEFDWADDVNRLMAAPLYIKGVDKNWLNKAVKLIEKKDSPPVIPGIIDEIQATQLSLALAGVFSEIHILVLGDLDPIATGLSLVKGCEWLVKSTCFDLTLFLPEHLASQEILSPLLYTVKYDEALSQQVPPSDSTIQVGAEAESVPISPASLEPASQLESASEDLVSSVPADGLITPSTMIWPQPDALPNVPTDDVPEGKVSSAEITQSGKKSCAGGAQAGQISRAGGAQAGQISRAGGAQSGQISRAGDTKNVKLTGGVFATPDNAQVGQTLGETPGQDVHGSIQFGQGQVVHGSDGSPKVGDKIHVPQASPGEPGHSFLGKTHPFSPIEKKLAKALDEDTRLKGFFLYNQQVNAQDRVFIVDFYWPVGGLVVEADGYAYHKGFKSFQNDRLRDYYLTISGMTVLRLTGLDIMSDIKGSLNRIYKMVQFVSKKHNIVL
jgi:very-short-patch-repair endonuclease